MGVSLAVSDVVAVSLAVADGVGVSLGVLVGVTEGVFEDCTTRRCGEGEGEV